MEIAQHALVLTGAFVLASTLAACGGSAQAGDSGRSGGEQTGDGSIRLGELDADSVEGKCKQALGSVEDVFAKLELGSDPKVTHFDDWGDEFFPQDGSEPATIRCQGNGSYETDDGVDGTVKVHISIAAGDSEPRGVTDFTVTSDGMTAGMSAYTEEGEGMDQSGKHGIVEKAPGEQYLTDEVLTRFKP